MHDGDAVAVEPPPPREMVEQQNGRPFWRNQCPSDGVLVQKLRQLLQDVADLEIDTVDGFQGREKEAVVVSLVRSNEQGELGFVADIRRINVALTRARKKLIVVGDSATIARHPFHEGFVRYAERIGAWRSAWDR